MKTEVKLGLGIGALLLAVVGAAFVFMPQNKDGTVGGGGAGGTASNKPAVTPEAAPVPAGFGQFPPTATMPAVTSVPPTTAPSGGMTTNGLTTNGWGSSTQPVAGGLSPTTQPLVGETGGSGLGGNGMGGTTAGSTAGSTAGTPSTPVDWNSLLAGSQTTATPGGSGRAGTGSGAGLPPSVGPRGGTPAGSDLPPIGGTRTNGTKPGSYTIRAGDTLSKISTTVYGSPNFWSKLVQANPGLNPNRLKTGQVITIPDAAEVKPSAAAAPKAEKAGGSSLVRDPKSEYQVMAGDSLEKIAAKLYGNGSRWKEIYDLNKSKIGSSPRNLKVGMTLRLPAIPATPATRAS